MLEPGAVLDMSPLGVRAEIRQSAPEVFEVDVIGRARGLITQPHVHLHQAERHEVIEGSMRLVIEGREHLLGPGDAMEVPAGAEHTQIPGKGGGEGRVRITLRPARRIEAFFVRLTDLCETGQMNRFGFPRPVAAARLVQDFADEGHGTRPPLSVQKPLAAAILKLAARSDGEYVFVDEWDVAAAREDVFAALADARSYPDWWRPVYLDVASDGAPHVGSVSHQHFK